ncbi:zinc knuckle CX2CX4HX4C [Artemisia annua]|uniref:Zinc knuckle CX2CX4HX4C n=1 Tax=Artemisia annua TaxID=35608 RepID=A0A2U1N0P1_ARTAN|nr:zinc knuckle CX2CX4HX4C [Artemisia annua]
MDRFKPGQLARLSRKRVKLNRVNPPGLKRPGSTRDLSGKNHDVTINVKSSLLGDAPIVSSNVNREKGDVQGRGNVNMLHKKYNALKHLLRARMQRWLIQILRKTRLFVDIPKLEGSGYIMENIRVEYEWKPPRCRCDECKIFNHSCDNCPKQLSSSKAQSKDGNQKEVQANGFQSLKRKTSKGGNWESKGKCQSSGLNKSTNGSYRSVVKPKSSTAVSNPFSALEDDNGNSMDDLVDDTRKKPRNTGNDQQISYGTGKVENGNGLQILSKPIPKNQRSKTTSIAFHKASKPKALP